MLTKLIPMVLVLVLVAMAVVTTACAPEPRNVVEATDDTAVTPVTDDPAPTSAARSATGSDVSPKSPSETLGDLAHALRGLHDEISGFDRDMRSSQVDDVRTPADPDNAPRRKE